MQYVKKCNIDMAYRSDHSVITLKFQFDDIKYGKSYWKHNNSLLTDKEYLDIINKHIKEIKRQYAIPIYNLEEIENIPDQQIQFTINDQLFLDHLLMEFWGKAISYSSYKHKERNKKEKYLIDSITEMENNLKENNMKNLENLKIQLNDIRQEKLKGHIIRSRVQHIDKGEKPTKYFCGLEQHNSINKTLNELELDNGTIITEQNAILKETEIFYKNLYNKFEDQSETIDLETYIDSNLVTKLTERETEQLEGRLTYSEISKTLKNMKNDKGSGLYGFSADFLKVFLEATGILCTQINKLWIQHRTTFNNSKTRHNNMYPKR